MKIHRFYTERKNLRLESSVKLNDSDVKLIRDILHLKAGDTITLFNGEKEFNALLKIVRSDLVTAMIKGVRELEKINGVEFTLFQSLMKAGKFDTIVEQGTELGVNNIIPVEADYSQSKLDSAQKKLERWKSVSIASARRAQRVTLPEIFEPIKFNEIEKVVKEFDYLFILTTKGGRNINDTNINVGSAKKVGFIIGPEGGFSPKEMELANNWDLILLTINSNHLQSETAAVAALTLLKNYFV